jgi:flagellar motor switch protein FliM
VAIGIEIRIGEVGGMMNIALPSIVIKMMRQKFDQQWSLRKTRASSAEQSRVLRLVRDASLTLESRLDGPTVTVEDLLAMEEGHVLMLDYPVNRPVELLVNGAPKFLGQVVSSGRKRGCMIEEIRRSPAHPTSKEEDKPVSPSPEGAG